MHSVCIEKTRQIPNLPAFMIPKKDKPRGIIHQQQAGSDIVHERFLPSPDLAFFIEHFWTVRWNFEGREPMRVETLPHPVVHLVFENGEGRCGGIANGKFSRLLEGKNFVFSVKFRPGAFYCFYQKPVSELTNKTIHGSEIFGKAFFKLEKAIFKSETNAEMFSLTEAFLRKQKPAEDENVTEINLLLQRIISQPELTKVEQLLPFGNRNLRSLQRLLKQYLGVSPKWVIARYRIHEALERIRAHQKPHWAKLANDLGYSDQAHFIRDFKKLIGKTPLEYAKAVK